ncbi:MAG: hypothetical protein WCC48_00745 [Anaeromyxobacteraceae bacterium]
MLIVTRLPTVEQAQNVKDAVEPGLLQALQGAAQAAPDAVRVVTCSGGAWLVGLLSISTDPGLAARKEDLRASLAQIESQVEKNKADLEAARQRKKQLDEVEVPKARQDLDAVNEALQAARDAAKKAKEEFDKEFAGSRRQRPELTAKQQTLQAKRRELSSATEKAAQASKAYNAKNRSAAEAAKPIARCEAASEKLKKDQADRKVAFEKVVAAKAASAIPLKDGKEGWLAEGRALMLPGHFANQYRYFVHLTNSAERFSKNTSLTALATTTELHGLRAFSGRHVREHAHEREFSSGQVLVSEVRSQTAAARRYLADEAVLIVAGTGPGTSVAVRETAGGREVPLADGDVVLLRKNVGGTNMHRAHNAPGLPGADGRLHGPARASLTVANWSEGCQVFPSSVEFNLFISLCAVSKRWRCVCQKGGTRGAGCSVLEAGAGEALGAGEEALVKGFGKDFLDAAGDFNRTYIPEKGVPPPGNAERAQKLRRIKELTWNDEDRAKLTELMKKKKDLVAKCQELNRQDTKDLTEFESKRSRRLNDAETRELERLEGDRARWRRDYLREKTLRLAADHLRSCDVTDKCGVRFSYTLIEMASAELGSLEAAFKESRNRAWDGRLG